MHLPFSELTRERFRNFKKIRRAYFSLWILSMAFILSLFSEFIANDKPLILKYQNHYYFPILHFYSDEKFGGVRTNHDLPKSNDEPLPIEPASLELVVSALALQFVNDLPGLLAQIRHALKPDGLFLAAIIGGDTLTELRQSFAAAEAEIEGGVSPRVIPFVDVRDAGSLLQRAGFALPVTDVDRITVRYDNAFALMQDLRRMGATNILVERSKKPTRRATMLRMVEIYSERFADPDGRIRATFDIVWMSGWTPHESQQKPLKPGSAKMSLADAVTKRAPKT